MAALIIADRIEARQALREPGAARATRATTPSVRFWPNVASTLDGDRLTYANRMTGREETIQAANIGIANTPLIVNVSVGYSFF